MAVVTQYTHSGGAFLVFEKIEAFKLIIKQAQLCNKLRLHRHLLHERWAWPRRRAFRWAFGPTRLFSQYIIISM